MRRIFAQVRKELTQIVRDRLALSLALILPIMQLMLMGNAISLSVEDLPVAVQDLDDSPSSHLFIDAFRQSITFHVIPFSTKISPDEGSTSRLIILRLVVLPHPEGPTSARMLPTSTSSESRSTTGMPSANTLVTDRNSTPLAIRGLLSQAPRKNAFKYKEQIIHRQGEQRGETTSYYERYGVHACNALNDQAPQAVDANVGGERQH